MPPLLTMMAATVARAGTTAMALDAGLDDTVEG
jgi:hypothetical protein